MYSVCCVLGIDKYLYCVIVDMDIHLVSYYIGIIVLFLFNISLLFGSWSYKYVKYYSVVNIMAALLIAYYFMYKEKFISF
jgi:hypothetical protein